MAAPGRNFRELFCEHFGCPTEAYDQKVFWRCVHRRSLPLAAVIYFINRDFFKRDFDTIRHLGITRSQGEFQKEVEDYYFNIRSYGNVFQRMLLVRVSGQRLVRLSRLVRHAAGASGPAAGNPTEPAGRNGGWSDA